MEEAIDKKIPPLERPKFIEALPCNKHGHPGILPSSLRAWVDFFNVVAPYSTERTLDHALISKICDAYGIPFMEAFEHLSVILRTISEVKKDGG